MIIESKSSDGYGFPFVRIAGFKTASVTRKELADTMVADCIKAREAGENWLPRLVFSSNGQGIAEAGRSNCFSEAMSEAQIIHADGMPVVFASKLTKHPLPERIATTDFFHDAARAAKVAGLRFFILGATEDQNKKAVEKMSLLYPDLVIAGRHHGYFGEDDDERICREIREAKTDVLWVALGKPRQEFWSVRNKNNLKGVGWIKTCGGLYAFLAGDAPRAPGWMQNLGLEWLYRAIQEPKRLGVRYLTTNPYSLYRIFRYTDRK